VGRRQRPVGGMLNCSEVQLNRVCKASKRFCVFCFGGRREWCRKCDQVFIRVASLLSFAESTSRDHPPPSNHACLCVAHSTS
jgi:hypothetical protein